MRHSFWTKQRIAIAAVSAAILLLVPGLSWIQPSEPKVTYTLEKAAYGTVTTSVRASGTLGARDAFEVATETGGQVQSIAVHSGDRVVKGQILARLESTALREELLRAQTGLASSQADVKQAEAETAAARASAAHLSPSASVQEHDAAEARIIRAAAAADKLRVDLRAAEMRISDVRARIAKLDVRAPSDGIVLKRNLDPSARARVGQGQGLLILTSALTSLNISVDIPESELGSVHPGQAAEFTVPAFEGRTFRGVVSSIDLLPKKESADGGVKISYSGVLIADNPHVLLRPGMSASVSIIVARAANVLVVPNGALTFVPPDEIEAKFPPPKRAENPRPSRVWVMRGGMIEPRDIVTGLSDGVITQVVAGTLRAGETVVTGAAVSVKGAAV